MKKYWKISIVEWTRRCGTQYDLLEAVAWVHLRVKFQY